MKVYMMRHGQTDWNLLGKIQGQMDISLNDVGKKQAEDAREYFERLDINLIICSTLKRARETASIINKKKKIKIIYSDRLIERGLGDYEGTNCCDSDCDIYNYNLNLNVHNIETVVHLYDRISLLLDNLKNLDKNILLITHSGTARAIEGYFLGMDEKGNLPPETLQNCEIREYEFNE